MKKIIQSLRVEENTLSNMQQAIKKYNKKNLVELSEAEFRRLSYELLSQMILQDIPIPIKLTKANGY